MVELHRDELEFPVKVEGALTLPYTSRIEKLDLDKGILYLKLIRPLPHEMAVGAPFQMLFATGEQRFEAPITFLGRESYLLYRFSIPAHMTQSDRRQYKRYSFRPREPAYVLAQDGGLPGHGLAGPLVNLSLGGLSFRVDRVMRLESTDSLGQALDCLRADTDTSSRLLVVESPAEAKLELGDIRIFQKELGELRELPVALVQAQGLPPATDTPLIRPLPWPGPNSADWLPLLDDLVGL